MRKILLPTLFSLAFIVTFTTNTYAEPDPEILEGVALIPSFEEVEDEANGLIGPTSESLGVDNGGEPIKQKANDFIQDVSQQLGLTTEPELPDTSEPNPIVGDPQDANATPTEPEAPEDPLMPEIPAPVTSGEQPDQPEDPVTPQDTTSPTTPHTPRAPQSVYGKQAAQVLDDSMLDAKTLIGDTVNVDGLIGAGLESFQNGPAQAATANSTPRSNPINSGSVVRNTLADFSATSSSALSHSTPSGVGSGTAKTAINDTSSLVGFRPNVGPTTGGFR